jgi:two-component system, OmpR family, sensor histidine kinase SenX3
VTLALAVLALVAGAVIGWWLGRRRLSRQIVAVTRRSAELPASTAALAAVERSAAADRAELLAAQVDADTLRAALDALPIGVVVVDDRGHVVLRTRAAHQVVGARHADVLVDEAIAEHVDTGSRGAARRQQLELYGPPSRTVFLRSLPVTVGSTASDGPRVPHAVVVTVEDVTERVRLESMRTDFVANISHELRTPVGGIALLAETLEGESDTQVVDRLAGKLLVEAHRVSRTIDDLLELSRLELEGARRDEVVIGVVIAEALDRVRSAAEHRSIRVDVGDQGRALRLIGDRRQLVSAVTNLVDNAIKYSESGSTVEVHADLVGDEVAVTVRDHGVGIPPADLDRIFERFYRVDRARSRETGGTGLGLAIVRHVATNHGGAVSVESVEGVGSSFTLHLPARAGIDADGATITPTTIQEVA